MRKLLGIFVCFLVFWVLISTRCGCSNKGTPEVTDIKKETIYSGSLASDPSYWFVSYSLYDSNRVCYLFDEETFMTIKKDESVISRDDECLHCKRAWKWHYNK